MLLIENVSGAGTFPAIALKNNVGVDTFTGLVVPPPPPVEDEVICTDPLAVRVSHPPVAPICFTATTTEIWEAA